MGRLSLFPWLRLPVIAILTLVASGLAVNAQAQDFQTDIPRALLIDVGTGTVLFEKGADDPFAPASMAKIMTAETLFHEITAGRLALDKHFHVSEYAWRTGGGPSRGTAMFAAVNSNIAVQDLLRGLVVPSGNDAAIVLAEGVAGTETAFTQMMNQRAQALGLKNTVFANSTGLNGVGQRTTARDLARLAKHISTTYPDLYSVFSVPEFSWSRINQRNRNPLLAMNIGADGLLTGFTEQAGFGIVGSAVLGGQRLVVVLSGAKSARERDLEARKLLDWGFRSFEIRQLFAAGEVIEKAVVFGGEKDVIDLISTVPVRVLVQRGGMDRVTARVNYRGPVSAPVEQGVPVGDLQILRGETHILNVPLQTREAVIKGSLWQQASDAVYEWATGHVRRAFERLM